MSYRCPNDPNHRMEEMSGSVFCTVCGFELGQVWVDEAPGGRGVGGSGDYGEEQNPDEVEDGEDGEDEQ